MLLVSLYNSLQFSFYLTRLIFFDPRLSIKFQSLISFPVSNCPVDFCLCSETYYILKCFHMFLLYVTNYQNLYCYWSFCLIPPACFLFFSNSFYKLTLVVLVIPFFISFIDCCYFLILLLNCIRFFLESFLAFPST